MIYRVLKAILNINQNIKKEDLMKVMSISSDKDKNHKFFIDLLTPDALKLKLGCLFNKYSKAKLCNWEQVKTTTIELPNAAPLQNGGKSGTSYETWS